jgi:hypothetical protein
MNMRIATVVFACAAIFFAVAAAGCNDEGESATIEEYFQELDGVDDQFESDTNDIDNRGQQLEDEDVDGATDLFEELIDVIEAFVDKLRDLDPPEEAEEAHDQAVENFEEAADEFRERLDAARDANSVEGFLESVFGTEQSDAIDAATEACLDLERIAADNDIDVDLDCEEEDE